MSYETQTYDSAVDALIRARDAGLLSSEEARIVALDMFPAAKKIAEAKQLIERVGG